MAGGAFAIAAGAKPANDLLVATAAAVALAMTAGTIAGTIGLFPRALSARVVIRPSHRMAPFLASLGRESDEGKKLPTYPA